MLGRGAVAGLLATAGLGVTIWAGALTPAGADPVPPVDPTIPVPAPVDPAAPAPADAAAPPPPVDPAAVPNAASEPPSLLGQIAQATQGNPYSAMKNLIGDAPQAMVVGTGTLPSHMDTTYADPANANPWNAISQLKPQNFRMPAEDQLSPYALSPNDNPSPFARVNAFKGVHAVTHSSLGRMPGSQLGVPLPGTAPPPGSNIPAGLEQFYVDPNAAPPPVPAPGATPLPHADPAATAPPPPAPPAPGGPVPVDPLLFGTGAN